MSFPHPSCRGKPPEPLRHRQSAHPAGVGRASSASQRPGVSQHFFYKAAPPSHMPPHPSHFLLHVHSNLLKTWSQSIQTNLLADYSFEQSWSGVEAYLLLSVWAGYTRKLSFRKGIQNHHIFVKTVYSWAMLILVSCANTKQKLKDIPVRLKVPILIWKEKHSWSCRKPSPLQVIPLTPMVMHYSTFRQKRKGKETS